MNLYQINEALIQCIDEETGEIIDIEKLGELELQRNEKIENIGLWIKNLKSDSEQLKHEIDVLSERKKIIDSKQEQLRAYLDSVLDGEKFETSKIMIFYRRSQAVEVADGFEDWAIKNGYDDCLSYKAPVPNKTAIKNYIKSGESFELAKLVERNSLNIK